MQRIIKIISIRDTREYMEVGDDTWKPIAGSGDRRECDRCGRMHEVHAEVELEDGARSIIGTGCARGDSMERDIQRGANRAKRRAKLEAEIAATRARAERSERVWSDVEAEMLPSVERSRVIEGRHGTITVWRMGDAEVWTPPGRDFDREREATLAKVWRRNRYQERSGERRNPAELWRIVKNLERKLAKG